MSSAAPQYSDAAVEEGDRFPQTIEPGLSAAGLRSFVDRLQQPQVDHFASERADIDRWHTECDLVGLAQFGQGEPVRQEAGGQRRIGEPTSVVPTAGS